jgi:hypothetical protein
MRSLLGRFLVSLALAGLSAEPVLAAAGPSPGDAAPPASFAAAAGLATQLWGWMWTIWPEGGCLIDPDGQCRSSAPRTWRDGLRKAGPAVRRLRDRSPWRLWIARAPFAGTLSYRQGSANCRLWDRP